MHQASATLTQSNINKTEAVQRRAKTFVTGDDRGTSSVGSMLEYFGMEYLHTCRQDKMNLRYRIINHLVEIQATHILQPVCASRKRVNNYRYLVPYCSVDAYKFAFFPIRNIVEEQSARQSVPSHLNFSRH